MIVTMRIANRWADPYVHQGYGEVTLECAEFRPQEPCSPEWWLMGRWTIDASTAEISGEWRDAAHRPPCYCPAHKPEPMPQDQVYADPTKTVTLNDYEGKPRFKWRPWRR